METQEFTDLVWQMGARHARQLPWRNINDAYAVLVSEVMLQQTQVKRVLDYWPRWMAQFPTLDALAAASTSDVLAAWQGLGYNRRALALKRCAEQCSAVGGVLPATHAQLQALPGIGPTTAAGVMAFAHNVPGVYLDTNVRSVYLHCFFPDAEGVKDKQLAELVEQTCPADNPRSWYYALLDFGAYLKSQGVNPSRRSAHYAKQSKFEGSRRQKRANLLRIVLDDPGITAQLALIRLNDIERAQGRQAVDERLFYEIAAQMAAEGFFEMVGEGVQACYTAERPVGE